MAEDFWSPERTAASFSVTACCWGATSSSKMAGASERDWSLEMRDLRASAVPLVMASLRLVGEEGSFLDQNQGREGDVEREREGCWRAKVVVVGEVAVGLLVNQRRNGTGKGRTDLPGRAAALAC